MKKYTKFILLGICCIFIIVVFSIFLLRKDNFIIETTSGYEAIYYPNKMIEVLQENTLEQYSNKIVLKNITNENQFYQIKITGLNDANLYLQYKKNNDDVSSIIFLKDEVVIDSTKLNGKYFFTDNYNQEYSRDIEPMVGGHGSQYYEWLKQYIQAYKNHSSCPRLVESGY